MAKNTSMYQKVWLKAAKTPVTIELKGPTATKDVHKVRWWLYSAVAKNKSIPEEVRLARDLCQITTIKISETEVHLKVWRIDEASKDLMKLLEDAVVDEIAAETADIEAGGRALFERMQREQALQDSASVKDKGYL